jgi:DNA-binding transcriptional ArsR family regulator
MVQYAKAALDASFSALSDATRRGVLEQLGRDDASIRNLAETFHMTRTGTKKQVSVLEEAGLVATEKVGRVRTCMLGPRRSWHELHPSKEALDAARASGVEGGMLETFGQLDVFVADLSAGRS